MNKPKLTPDNPFTLYDLRGDWVSLEIKKSLLKQLNKKLASELSLQRKTIAGEVEEKRKKSPPMSNVRMLGYGRIDWKNMGYNDCLDDVLSLLKK